MDFSPSMLSVAHVQVPDAVHLDGEDMSAQLLGESTAQRAKPVMWVRPPDRPGPRKNLPDLAMREGQWKLLVFRDGTRAELYDIDADQDEKNNLAKANPDLVKKMTSELIAWDKQTTK
jgi:uncharacterized sulfatase